MTGATRGTPSGVVSTARAGRLGAAVAALTAPDLAGVVDLVAYPEPGAGGGVVVARHDGAVRLVPPDGPGDGDGRHDVLRGRDPVASTDPMAFLPYGHEVGDPSPPNDRNAYPEPGRRLRSFFDDPGRSPDLAVVHTPSHYFPEAGGHRGEHGSLDVVQSRAPFLLSGAGVARLGVVEDWTRIVDVAPTLLRAAGVSADRHCDGAGAPLDGTERADLLEAGRGRFVVGLLWDGAHCSDLLHLAGAGELPGVARLLEHGVALAGGAVAEFPSVTLCNHTSALTGIGPGRHGVLGNVFFDRDTGERVVPNDATTWHRSADWLRPAVATVFEQLSLAAPGALSACINEAVDRGATVSTMQAVRSAGGMSGAAGLDGLLPDAAASRFVGNPEWLSDGYVRWATRVDDAGLSQVLDAWAGVATAPRLTWWASVVTDAGHHAGGPRSAVARDTLRDADRRLCAWLDHLDRLGVADDVTVLLTADHGFEAADESVTGTWRPALDAALGAGTYRDEGPGFVYLDAG